MSITYKGFEITGTSGAYSFLASGEEHGPFEHLQDVQNFIDNEQDIAPRPQFYSVAVYLEDRSYGGPEEGGWWFDCGERIDDMRELADLGPWRTPRLFLTEESANLYCQKVNDRIAATINVGRREISSVLSTGRYSALVMEGYPPKHFPETRPHYE